MMQLTLCPARMQSDSLSIASLRLSTLSSIRVIVISSSEGLKKHQIRLEVDYKDTHLPAKFVLAGGHR